jgi:type IV secretion system protein TrbI
MSSSGQSPDPNDRKLEAADLRLRSAAPAVTRISPRVLAVAAGVAGVALGGALLYALDPPQLFRRDRPELYNTDAKPGADGLAGLPRDYASIPKPPNPPAAVPQLGPPLPGDLGRPLLRAQGAAERQVAASRPEADPEASKRLQEADQALRSRVFFQLASRQRAGAPASRGEASSRSGETADTENLAIGSDPELRQNMQDRKLAFLRAPADRQVYASHAMQRPASDYQLMAGTVIPAALVTAVESDLPGLVKAQVTEPVYDTVTGRHCLVPQGSALVGTYDSQIAFAQRRVQLVWTRLLRPDGTSIVLDRLPATDAIGKAGLKDEVDHHWGRLFVAAAVSTLLGVGAELGASDADRLIDALRRGGQDTFNRAGQDIVRRNLNIQPTLTLRPGLPLRVIVQRDIVLPPVRRSSEGTCQA